MQRPKFQIQKKTMDFTRKIRRVIDETTCHDHDALPGHPCYKAPFGVCNKRAKQIFTGIPSERASTGAREYKRNQKENAV